MVLEITLYGKTKGYPNTAREKTIHIVIHGTLNARIEPNNAEIFSKDQTASGVGIRGGWTFLF